MGQLSPQAFVPLHRLIHLEELDLCGCRVEDSSTVELLNAAAPSKFHTLNLTWCPALTDVAVLAIARGCSKLQWLSLFGNMNITNSGIEALAEAPCSAVLHSLD